MTSATAPTGSTADGSFLRIRELGPDDGDIVDVVFARLSPRSRYLRYRSHAAEISADVRRSLNALDGRSQVALAAFAAHRGPIGIVRIVDLGQGRAKLAVEVVDRWQCRGVGTRLLQAARDRAAALGYRELVGEVLPVNDAALGALRRVFPVVRVRRDGAELLVAMPVSGPAELVA